MAWFKLTAPNGDPVQVNGDQLVCVRVPLAGIPPGPRTQAIIEFTTGHTRQRWRRRIKFWIGSPERLRLSKRLGLWEPQRLWERRPRCDRRRDGRNDGRLGKADNPGASLCELSQLQPLMQRPQHVVRRDDGFRWQALRKPLRPGLLASACGLEQLFALPGQPHQLGAAVMRVLLENDDPFRDEFVDDALHALPMQPHRAGKPCHGLRRRRQRRGAEHLPARAR
jgi:hypothetical protein